MAKNEIIATSKTLNELVPLLNRCIKRKRPVFLWSGPGIGKSSIVASIAKNLGGICIDVRLSQMDPTDVRGIPYYAAGNGDNEGLMRWAAPDLLPTEEFAKQFPVVILFLDELNGAAPAVQAAAYQLVLDRKVGSYTLPSNVAILAAGNHESDRGVTYRMASPLANRLSHFSVRADIDSWMDWALAEKINPDILSYLLSYKDKLYGFDPSSSDKAFPTPRSWAAASDLITVEPDERKLRDDEIRDLVTATIGSGPAGEFISYLKIGKNLPHPADILSGKITSINTQEVSAHYQIIVSMLYEMNNFWHTHSNVTGEKDTAGNNRQVEKREWHTDKDYLKTWEIMFNNFNTFNLTQVKPEIGIMGTRMAFRNYNFGKSMPIQMLTKNKTWLEIAAKWGKYIQAQDS